MKSKEFILDNNTIVKVSKRASSRKIRLSINPDGSVRVSIPKWMPFKLGIDFAKSKSEWISKQKPTPKILENNQTVGKNHHLKFVNSDNSRVTTRVNDIEVIVFMPNGLSQNDTSVQIVAKRAYKKALMSQAKLLLPQRVMQLANKHGYEYNEIIIKSLKTRWGSCDSHKNITLNLFLMDLPWELIDYVIVHELNHTKHMNHSVQFWQEMDNKLPNTKDLRKAIKQYKANI